jgi:CelD/BcsL family acetyltransferase involved in cellulose biosynthesis
MYFLNDYTINVATNFCLHDLKKNWIALESRNQIPFFLSWQWIATWIETYSPELLRVTASHNNEVVAIGLFTTSSVLRHNIIRSKQLRLNQVGNTKTDQIWIEYNDFICDRTHCESAINACLMTLLKHELKWDELIISMMPYSRADSISKIIKSTDIDMITPSYSVNLSNIRENDRNYLDTLSANTRYQIRHSIRQYEKKYGELALYQAKNKQQAIEYFDSAGRYHVQRWPDSGFSNPLFVQFHQNLISRTFSSGAIHVLHLKAGGESIAYLYYHVQKRDVFFYLQGVNYSQDKKLKPGLVAHMLATQYFINLGMNLYDYMGGYSQYKTQLASKTGSLANVTIQRPRSRFKFENMARLIKNRIMRSLKQKKLGANE